LEAFETGDLAKKVAFRKQKSPSLERNDIGTLQVWRLMEPGV
jgi:hypothetical protein